MRVTIRSQSQLLPRRSYKPQRTLRVRPVSRGSLVFRPSRLGAPRWRLEPAPPGNPGSREDETSASE